MAERPYVDFQVVKQRVPIPDTLDVLGIADQFTRKGDVLTGCCPLPDHQHGPSPNAEQFKINRKHGSGPWLFHCFGDCQRGGDVVEFVKLMTGHDNAHVRFWFAEHFGDRLELRKPRQQKRLNEADNEKRPDTKKAHGESRQKASPQAVHKATNNVSDAEPSLKALRPLRFCLNLDPAVPYLLDDRKLTPETVARFGLGLATRGLFKGYVCIPIFDFPHSEDANPVGYLGRWPGEDFDEEQGRTRYKWPEGFPKSRIVYGLAQALETGAAQPLIVVEGAFKLFHLAQSGFPNTVSILGSSMSEVQADILCSTGQPIVLMFDGNEAGYLGMRNAAGKLITRSFVQVVKLPEGVEPDHLSAGELHDMLSFTLQFS